MTLQNKTNLQKLPPPPQLFMSPDLHTKAFTVPLHIMSKKYHFYFKWCEFSGKCSVNTGLDYTTNFKFWNSGQLLPRQQETKKAQGLPHEVLNLNLTLLPQAGSERWSSKVSAACGTA